MYDLYANKYFSILGDSISTLEGYSEPRNAAFYDTEKKLASGVFAPSYTWWGKVIDRLGGTLLVNNSFSGSTVCWRPAFEIASYACSDKRTSALGRDGISPDVIMVYMGTNDWGSGFRIAPNEHIRTTAEDRSWFLGAYKVMLEKLRRNYPHAEIWCFTLSVSCCSAEPAFAFPYYYGGIHMEEYCNAIRTAAKEYGCRVIDLYQNAHPYDTIDKFHANASGMETLANSVLESLESSLKAN